MDPVTVKVTLPGIVAEMLEDQRPRSLPTATFCAFLIEQGLDRAFTLGLPSAAGSPSKAVISSSTEEKELKPKKNTRVRELTTPRDREENPRAQRDPFSRKQLPPDAVPVELADCAELLQEFWFVKKGTRSERAWNRLINKLRTFSEKDRLEALQAACNAGWADVYEPKPPLINGKPAQPELKHPAAREFRGGRFVDEPTTNPALENLF
jgi:hypothetical protein